MYRPHLLLSVPKLIVACWLVCSWILSSAEMKICTRSLLMYVDVGFPTRPHSSIPCIAGNGLHPAIIYQIIDLAPHTHRAIGAAIGEERAYSYAYVSYYHIISGGGRAFHFRCNYGHRRWKNPDILSMCLLRGLPCSAASQTVVVLIEERVEDDGHCSAGVLIFLALSDFCWF